MNKVYTRINWENYPSEATALDETNLNKMDFAIDELDNRLIEQDATKLSKTDASNDIVDLRADEDTGIITATRRSEEQIILDATGNDVRTQINELKSDLVKIADSKIPMEKIDLYGIDYNDYNGIIYKNAYLNGYNTNTYMPNIINDSSVFTTVIDFDIPHNNPILTIPIIDFDKTVNRIVIYKDGGAINLTSSDFVKDAWGIIDVTDTSFTINTNVNFSDYDRIAVTLDSNTTIKFNKIDNDLSNYINTSIDKKFINVMVSQETGNGGDGSSLIIFKPFGEVKDVIVKFTGNYTFSRFILWTNLGEWIRLGEYTYKNGGVRLNLPANCGMIQVFATTLISDDSKVTTTIEEYTTNNRLDNIENSLSTYEKYKIIASVNMFNSIGAIGDSYTAGSAKNSNGQWNDVTEQSWIATMAKRSGISFSNYGLGGATTLSYITDKLPSVLSAQPNDLYFMALGQNDGNQSLTIGNINDIHDDDYTNNPDTFYGCYGKIIAQVMHHAPNAKIVMIKNWISGDKWTPYDNAIETIAEHYNIPCINPFDDDLFSSSIYTNYKPDGHPTAMGYSMMGIAMERLFSKCVLDNPSYFMYSTIG